MALQALIFDLDGTLVDANGLHVRAWVEAFEAHGFRLPAARILPEIGKGSGQLVSALLGAEAEQARGEALRAAHDAAYLDLVEREGVQAFPDVHVLFEALGERGLRTAVATASNKESLEKVMEHAGLDLPALVDAVVTDDDVARSKPAPDTVIAAVEKLHVSPAACAMVGDTPYDALAGRRAGVVCLGLRTGVHSAAAFHRAGARASYADLAELRAHVDEALHVASPGAAVLTRERMAQFMREALDEAQAGLEEGEVPIGSVLARGDGAVVARGHNRTRSAGSPLAHAEMQAMQQAGARLDEAAGHVLVTTVEPCVMCLGAAMEAGIDTVIYALDAPDNGGAERCTPVASGFLPRLVGGVEAARSRALLEQWLDAHPDDAFAQRLVQA